MVAVTAAAAGHQVIATEFGGKLTPANVLAEGVVVYSGAASHCLQLLSFCDEFMKRGQVRARASRVAVAGAFHSPLMQVRLRGWRDDVVLNARLRRYLILFIIGCFVSNRFQHRLPSLKLLKHHFPRVFSPLTHACSPPRSHSTPSFTPPCISRQFPPALSYLSTCHSSAAAAPRSCAGAM